jgi:hypothetical protein
MKTWNIILIVSLSSFILLAAMPFRTKSASISEFNQETASKVSESSADIFFYLTEDKQAVIALKNNKVEWLANVIDSCGAPNVGKPKIRSIKIINEKVLIVYGKHNHAELNVYNGKTTCLGSD